MIKELTIFFLCITTNIFGQTSLPNKVHDYVNLLNIKPLEQVDTISERIPKNFVTKSNWHVDYYAGISMGDGPVQLNLYTLIYNDSIFSASWSPFTISNKNEYDCLEVRDETPEYIYFGNSSIQTEDYLYVVSKTKDNLIFQFSNLLFKDIQNGIFVEYSTENHVESDIQLALDIVNIKTVKFDKIVFSGCCTEIKSCLNKFTYINGEIVINATLRERKTKNTYNETKTLKI